ncbi:MAG: hypothetical protein ACRELX_05365, partial [Longimicrobiales bacterium]
MTGFRNGLGIVALALVCVLGACDGSDQTSGAAAQTAGRGGGPAGAASQVVVVATRPVETGRIARAITVPGTVEPIRTVGVNAQLEGALRTV